MDYHRRIDAGVEKTKRGYRRKEGRREGRREECSVSSGRARARERATLSKTVGLILTSLWSCFPQGDRGQSCSILLSDLMQFQLEQRLELTQL